MDFGKAHNSKCHDFDLNIPYVEDLNSNDENQFSALIQSNTPQNNNLDMNITVANNDSDRVFDDDVRQVQLQLQPTTYIDSLHVAGYHGITMGGRRRYRRRGQAHPIDPLRFCTNYHCRTRKTPLWRKGPLGPKTLCNACGIYYMKQVTRRGSGIPPHAPAVPVRGDASASSSISVPPVTVQGNSSNF